MDLDNFELDEISIKAAEKKREQKLQSDEVPVDTEGADDCDSGACAI